MSAATRLENVVLQADESLRSLASNRRVMIGSLTWASLNWLLDAASLWCFIAAFGAFANPVGLFAAYGIANVLGAIPITPAGLGVIDSVTPVLLVSFGLTRSVATLGVLAWRLVNFWLPIPTGRRVVHLAQGAAGLQLGGYAPGAGRLVRPRPRRTARTAPAAEERAGRPPAGRALSRRRDARRDGTAGAAGRRWSEATGPRAAAEETTPATAPEPPGRRARAGVTAGEA